MEKITREAYSNHQKKIKTPAQNKSSSDKHQEEMRLRLRAAMQNRVIIGTSQRIPLQFDEIMEYNGNNCNVKLCESCFIYLHDEVCSRTFATWKKALKKRIAFNSVSANMRTSLAPVRLFVNGTNGRYRNILEARKALDRYGLTETELHLCCLPNRPADHQAYLWLAKFFALIGDHAPNRDNKVQIPGIYTKSSIYSMYRHNVTEIYRGDEHEVLSKSSFMSIWKNIFPNVTVTKFCLVSGKCTTCHSLYERMEVFRDEKELEIIKSFANIHKITVEAERGCYMKKRQMAQEHPNLYMSLIIDGMSQDHCILPYCANKVTKNNIIKQKIVGAKQHGFRKSFYRTFPHISGGTNVAIEVLCHEIYKRMKYCKDSNIIMPNVLYLQIDGGPENTSKTFYGMLTKLVRSDVFKKIEVTRLPVGHTHEDIDALFGTLWRSYRNTTVLTPKHWKHMAMQAFIKGDEDFIDKYDDFL